MRRCTGASTFILLGLGLFIVDGSAVAGDRDLFTNGGFEDGLSGWRPDPGHEIVRDQRQAHSGSACLSGEVSEPGKARMLRRQVKVMAGNRYEFVAWARATNRTKLVLWMKAPGAKQRSMVASWPRVPARWTRYSAPIAVPRDGMLELEVVAPSSHGEPAGKIWIDDLALLETAMPPLTPISKERGFNDEPSMAMTSDGSLFIAWNSFRDGFDSLQVARLESRAGRYTHTAEWQIVGGEGTYLQGIQVVSAGDRVAVVYAAETGGSWNVHALLCGKSGPDTPLAVTTSPVADVKPAAVWNDSGLWIAWESSNAGRRQIFTATMRDGKISKPRPLSGTASSSYGPSIAVLKNGEVCVAWHGFQGGNYDIYLRRRGPGGTWGGETRLTSAPTVDRHPVLFTRGNELWLVYENALVDRYRVGTTNRRRLIVGQVTQRGLLKPEHAVGSSPLDGRSEAPAAMFDDRGVLWLAFLKPRLPRSGWDVHLTYYAGGRWHPSMALSLNKGMDRRPSLAMVKQRGAVVFQADTIPNSWSDVDLTLDATSDIFLATFEPFDVGAKAAPAAQNLKPLVEPDDPFEAGELRVARGEETPTPAITYEGKTLHLYYGDLHEHTEISVCNRLGDQSVDESYQHMRDLVRLDFACVTDHGYNINPYFWSYTAKMARLNEDTDRFLTFLAEEWTSSFEKYDAKHPYGYYGHRNLIFADTYFPRWWNARNGQNPAQVWEELRKLKANFVHIPHQLADTGNVPTDWDFTDESAQPVAEIFQVRGSYEYRGTPREAARTAPQGGYFLQDAWARGIIIGVIASPDHGGGYGKACVYAPELTREAILDALRSRHCFGTTGARIFLDVRVNGHLMGTKLTTPPAGPVKMTIHVRCPGEIERLEVCRNNEFIFTRKPGGREAELTLTDRKPLPGHSYYYVRVIQKDEEIAWSSPVWFGAK